MRRSTRSTRSGSRTRTGTILEVRFCGVFSFGTPVQRTGKRDTERSYASMASRETHAETRQEKPGPRRSSPRAPERSNEDVARALKRQKRDDVKPPLRSWRRARAAFWAWPGRARRAAERLRIHIADRLLEDPARAAFHTSIRVTHCREAFACIVRCDGRMGRRLLWGRPAVGALRAPCREEGKLVLIHEATFTTTTRPRPSRRSTLPYRRRLGRVGRECGLLCTHPHLAALRRRLGR